jgi:hypothetical protein
MQSEVFILKEGLQSTENRENITEAKMLTTLYFTEVTNRQIYVPDNCIDKKKNFTSVFYSLFHAKFCLLSD